MSYVEPDEDDIFGRLCEFVERAHQSLGDDEALRHRGMWSEVTVLAILKLLYEEGLLPHLDHVMTPRAIAELQEDMVDKTSPSKEPWKNFLAQAATPFKTPRKRKKSDSVEAKVKRQLPVAS